jgi:hypothetical protein
MFPLHYVVYVLIVGIAFATGFYRLRRQRTIQPIVWLLGITACSEILCKVLALTIQNNIPVYHVYQPVQLTLWAVFFYRNMQSGWRKTVLPLWVALFLFSILNTLFIQPVNVFPGNLTKLESVVIMFWSFCLFSEFLDLPGQENIFLKSNFIICVAVMWFNLVSYLFFGLFNYYVSAPQLLHSVWSIHLFSNYTYYSLLLTAMLLKAYIPAHE